MARDQHRNRIETERCPDGPHGLRTSHLTGDPRVGADLAAWDFPSLVEDSPAEAGQPTQVESDPVPGALALHGAEELRWGFAGSPKRPIEAPLKLLLEFLRAPGDRDE